MLEIKKGYITKNRRILLNQINLKFLNQHIYGLVGINGSGKTMILRTLAGFSKLTKGNVLQEGQIIGLGDKTITNAGLVLGDQEFISFLTLEENLRLIKNICRNKEKIDLNYWINLYHLSDFKDILFKNLSLGTKKKMVLIQAFMDYPEILLLDEPMNGLDEKSVNITKQLIMKHKQNGLVIMTSHYKNDIEDLCDYIFHVKEGTIVSEKY
ncbi:ATP-binding cassette domain-containing protein [Streptococcus parauberis]|uniref:Lipopolysaccharide export system ATP-binding protein LptB n=3 Tax=Streptococcus parauberis TaxID=1348 RepID=A0A1S1ZQV8_9STRE|nr:ABC transporter ATP-binding protein [Streptococcus parauberis]AUT05530.1 putative ABC transporter ATP-binding protein YybJ [Streptococcus parauberis]EMG26446.1 ABC transporter, ATP-binding protein [Streptococcus parauberis KRS-02083]MDT2748260.1 ABC transporter ATP-binding protein [Streptococcus parauberis]OHY29997.1 ABC transporter ATP-binding protein [Streptococcus parauberis]PCH11406.1 Lipopolysaccharide export system ATP-binding protein LptB [Streptococcus parauberis]